MDIIQVLPEHISNQIAAGEVIERPSSCVKEMLENSLDSGATNIKVLIEDSGKKSIQVIDNGSGMSKEDSIICFQRHATSKIRTANDLFNINTMGFRGEAMASMAAISHIEMITKKQDKELGNKITIEGGKIKNIEKYATTTGTSIKIKNLFFNVPARRKFLKSNKIEESHIIEQFNRFALANPDISASLFIDKKKYFHLEKSNFRKRIVNIIGKKYNEKLVPVKESINIVSIDGFIGKPDFAKRRKGSQYFFVNGRFMKDSYLNNAINKAYKDLIKENYHPSYFINLKVNSSEIDINIHPTKTEVKFEHEKTIHAILTSCVKRSLGQYNIAPSLDFNTEPAFDIQIKRNNNKIQEPKIRIDHSYNPFSAKKIKEKRTDDNYIHEEDNQTKIKSLYGDEMQNEVMQINNDYIISKHQEDVIIVHQQRAHERIIYENLQKKLSNKISSQRLLFPEKVNLSKDETDTLSHISQELKNIGFEFQIESGNLNVVSVPTHCIGQNISALFEKIIEGCESDESDIKAKINVDINRKISKTLAIRSGKKLSKEEMKKIVSDLMECEMPSINPYGVRTYLNISNDEINKKFKT